MKWQPRSAASETNWTGGMPNTQSRSIPILSIPLVLTPSKTIRQPCHFLPRTDAPVHSIPKGVPSPEATRDSPNASFNARRDRLEINGPTHTRSLRDFVIDRGCDGIGWPQRRENAPRPLSAYLSKVGRTTIITFCRVRSQYPPLHCYLHTGSSLIPCAVGPERGVKRA
jgi:hypothetical protein